MDQQMENAHFLPLVMVINRLSIDPECLNLTQKYLVIYMVPFFPFVSSTLDETHERENDFGAFLGGSSLSC